MRGFFAKPATRRFLWSIASGLVVVAMFGAVASYRAHSETGSWLGDPSERLAQLIWLAVFFAISSWLSAVWKRRREDSQPE